MTQVNKRKRNGKKGDTSVAIMTKKRMNIRRNPMLAAESQGVKTKMAKKNSSNHNIDARRLDRRNTSDLLAPNTPFRIYLLEKTI